MKKIVTDLKIIKGILKEALFLDLEASLVVADSQIHGRIVELSDSADEAVLLYLDFDEHIPEFANSHELKIYFKNFRVQSELAISYYRPPFLMLKQPVSMILSNEREDSRHAVDSNENKWARISLLNGDDSTSGHFRLNNISRNGFGGELVYPAALKIGPGTKIECDYWYGSQWLPLIGELKSIRQLTQQDSRTNTCIIGVERFGSNVQQVEKIARAMRGACDLQLEVSFLAQPNKNIRTNIINVSVSGFLAEIHDQDVQALAIVSRSASYCGTSLKASLVSFEENLFRFQWISGDEADRLSWLKDISKYIGTEVDTNNLRSSEVLSLFCQSGALSDTFIREQKFLAQDFSSSLKTGNSDEPWLFRWTNRSEDKSIKAYVSAMKSGDNAWSVIDLVSDRYANKMSADFWPQFMTAFKDFSLSLSPCPKHFLAWIEGHKFHLALEEYLRTVGKVFCLGLCDMFYTRIENSSVNKISNTFILSQIKSNDFVTINDVRSKLSVNGLSEFSDLMDFSVNAFASPGCAKMFADRSEPFKREYWRVSHASRPELEFLCIYTLVPEGQNPGRFVDSIYLFDLNPERLNDLDWKDLKLCLLRQASSRGFSTHAIRRLAGKGLSSNYPEEISKLVSYSIHPQAWEFYNKS